MVFPSNFHTSIILPFVYIENPSSDSSSYTKILQHHRLAQFPPKQLKQNPSMAAKSVAPTVRDLPPEVFGTETPPEKPRGQVLPSRCSAYGDAGAPTLLSIMQKLSKGDELESSHDWCNACTKFYVQKGIGYLIDEDSIEEYEKVAKEKRKEKLEQQEGMELNFLSKLGHVQKIETLNGIADMKNELRSFMVWVLCSEFPVFICDSVYNSEFLF
ncbi:uncharacterized protein LOC131224988 [Magnolia sinica]|uniref:uncharacterized protein LOC131224988 n=1 Tax=Magnolia sinica TaxID=86752 RepID=UPI00265AC1D1|nr:uncharacterized protein LOC131224988 [Magnolia sinica]